MKIIKTYLPIFTGFYNTIFEPCNEDSEVDDINNLRESEGLKPIGYDDCQWDYKDYFGRVSEQCAEVIESELKGLGLIESIEYENLYSPKEYNFRNDSINIAIELTEDNIKAIGKYLNENIDPFKVYIKDKYTSCSGFISSYSNNVNDWIDSDSLEHKHKLGSILGFILLDNAFDQFELFDQLTDTYICASNYSELTGE